MSTPAPSFPDQGSCEGVRAFLRKHEYGEGPLRRKLGLPPERPLRTTSPGVLQEALATLPSPHGALVELFLLGRGQEAGPLVDVLGHTAVELFLASGLLAREGDRYEPAVRLDHWEGLWLASDRKDRHARRDRDFVPGPGGPTRTLADFILPFPVDSALDLGCGCGALSFRALDYARRVVATDLNPRAVAFTRFNARLNGLGGLEGMECREGSLFDPVAGERFDLILSNPPYAISPARTFLYRDGGGDIVRRILEEAPNHLSPGGHLQMMAEWPQADEAPWHRRLESWIPAELPQAWVLRFMSSDPRTHAERWLAQEYGGEGIPREVFSEWMAYLEEAGVGSVGLGLVVVRKGAEGGGSHRVFRASPPFTPGPKGRHLAAWMGAQQALASMESPARILDMRLAPSPYLVREDSRKASGGGWGAPSIRLRQSEGLLFGARADPVAAGVVGLLDGSRKCGEALEELCRAHRVSPEPFRGGLPGALAKLLALGLLVPGEEEG